MDDENLRGSNKAVVYIYIDYITPTVDMTVPSGSFTSAVLFDDSRL